MSYLRTCFASLAILVVTVTIAVPAHAQQKLPDSTLYTQYSTFFSNLDWV